MATDSTRQGPVLRTDRTLLRLAGEPDLPALLRFWGRNAERYSPRLPPDHLTRAYWSDRLARAQRDFEADRELRLFVFRPDGLEVIGSCSFAPIHRAPLHSSELGYGIDRDCEGQGYMSEAVRSGLEYMFDVQNVHRIEATYEVDNLRSARLLQRLGFTVEGTRKGFLHIDGVWQDHEVASLINPRWRAPRSEGRGAGSTTIERPRGDA